MAKKILLLGGTGAMGDYLVPQLLRDGYKVTVTSRGGGRSGINLKYIAGNAMDTEFLKKVIFEENYDAIIDFMVYSTKDFKDRIDILLENTKQYIYLSTYRVFSNEDDIITEKTPQLLHTTKDKDYLKTDEYALSKARGEDILRNHKHKNWTIVRPSITYSKRRFQLGVLEADFFIRRTLEGKEIAFPKEMLDKFTTMTWAGDVAKMIAGLVCNNKALGEDYNVVTSEAVKWSDIIAIYQKHIDLRVRPVAVDDFIKIYPGRYQVLYDRMFNRVMDNSKILKTSKIDKDDLSSIYEKLGSELDNFIQRPIFGAYDNELNNQMTHMLATNFEKMLMKVRPRARIDRLRERARIRSRLVDLRRKARLRTRTKEYVRLVKNRSKDGVIITLPGYYNYGNIIQKYALQKFLKNNKLSFDVINLPPPYHEYSGIYEKTKQFVDKNIKGYEYDGLSIQGFRNYIVGSDQVWRNWYGQEWAHFSPFFLEFLGDDTKANRISYAASFGVENLQDTKIEEMGLDKVAKNLSRFNSISVRERSGEEIVHSILKSVDKESKNVVTVLDPTFLVDKDDYSRLIDVYTLDTEREINFFSYVLDASGEKDDLIMKLSKNYKNPFLINPTNDTEYPAVETWLRGFRDADFVITDSFHGMVFSIINNTDFLIIGNKHRGLARFNNLLKDLNLESRLIDEDEIGGFDFASLDNSPINWSDVNKKLEKKKQYSKEWLLSCLV